MVHADCPRQSRAADAGRLRHHETFSDELTQAGIKPVDYDAPGTAYEAHVAPLRRGVRSVVVPLRSTNEDLR